MHSWGDDFKYFGDVGGAADEIGAFCRRWGRIAVTCTKEKYGTVRVYCFMSPSGLHSLTHPGYHYSQYPKWLWKLDIWVIPHIFRWTGITRLFCWYQPKIYRLAYKRALRKYPHIRAEILDCPDYSEFLEGL